jgi:hypothetical protein
VLESSPGRRNVVCHRSSDGTSGDPFLLSGHLDAAQEQAAVE